MAGENVGSVNVGIGADLSELDQTFSDAAKIVEQASSRMTTGLAPAGAAATDLSKPLAALSGAVQMLSAASVEQTKTLGALSAQMQTISDLGDFMHGVVEGAAEGMAEFGSQTARASHEGLEELPRAAEHTKKGIGGLLGTFREFRAEQMQQGRMARFFANELVSVVPASAEAKAGLSGMLGILIEGAAGGLSFGLALEVAKFSLEKLNEHFNREAEHAREWAQTQVEITRRATVAWRDFNASFTPQSKTGNTTLGLYDDLQGRINKLADSIRSENMASGWSKFWQRVLPGEDYIDRIRRFEEEQQRLTGQQSALPSSEGARSAREKERARASRDLIREREALEVKYQDDRFRIAQETQARLDALEDKTPLIERNLTAYTNMRLAIEQQGREETKRAEEAHALALWNARLKQAAVGASQERQIEISAEQQIAAESLKIQQARRTGDESQVSEARARIALIRAEAAEHVTLLRMKQEAQAREFAAQQRVVEAQVLAAQQERVRSNEALALKGSLLTASEQERAAIVERMVASEREAIGAKRDSEIKIAALEEEAAVQVLLDKLAIERRKNEDGSNQAAVDAIIEQIGARRRAGDVARQAARDQAAAAEEARRQEASKAAGPGLPGGMTSAGRGAMQAALDKRDAELRAIALAKEGGATEVEIANRTKSAEAELHADRMAAMATEAEERARLYDAADAAGQRMLAAQRGLAGQVRDFWLSATDSLASNWGRGIEQMINGSYRFQDLWKNIGRSLVGALAQATSQMLANWMMTIAKKLAIWVLGLQAEDAAQKTSTTQKIATKSAETASVVTMNAAQGATGAGASQASIPYVGPVLAIAAAASVFGALIAYLTMKSAAGGYDIPSGVNPVIQAHQEEMMLPASIAKPLRAAIAAGQMGGDGGGSGGAQPPISLSINAMDGASVMRVLTSASGKSALAAAITEAIRDGRLGLVKR